jgi:hypothetical protein
LLSLDAALGGETQQISVGGSQWLTGVTFDAGAFNREAGELIEDVTPATFNAHQRPFRIVKLHVRNLRKRIDQKGDQCPAPSKCSTLAQKRRSRTSPGSDPQTGRAASIRGANLFLATALGLRKQVGIDF